MNVQVAQGMQQLTEGVSSNKSGSPDDSVPFDSQSHKPRPDYLPSPDQIREECRHIRAGWSENEHWKRAGFRNGKPRLELSPMHVSRPASL